MRPYTPLVLVLGLVLLAFGCGGDSTPASPAQAGTSCGQPSGVPGEIVILQSMTCAEAVDVAGAYFKSGKAPGLWNSGGPNGSKGWQCGGNLPGKHGAIAQCTSYSTAASAQTQLAELFEVRPGD